MRGEIGIGSMKSRMVRERLQYLRREMQGENRLMKCMFGEMRENGAGCRRRTKKYIEWTGIEL